jgi:hypothetical protein
MGFAVPPRLRLERWALTPPFHLYRAITPKERRRADCSLWHFPSGRLTASPPACISKNPPAGAGGCKLRGIAPGGVRTFLPLRIASEEAILHPSRTKNSVAENRLSRKLTYMFRVHCSKSDCRTSPPAGRVGRISALPPNNPFGNWSADLRIGSHFSAGTRQKAPGRRPALRGQCRVASPPAGLWTLNFEPYTLNSPVNPPRPDPYRGCNRGCGRSWCTRPVPVGPGR